MLDDILRRFSHCCHHRGILEEKLVLWRSTPEFLQNRYKKFIKEGEQYTKMEKTIQLDEK